jgi:hypothetical protein
MGQALRRTPVSPIAEAFAELYHTIWLVVIVFSIGWTAIYPTLGTWVAVKMVRKTSEGSGESRPSFGPVLVVHLLYSLLLANPYALFFVLIHLSGWPVAMMWLGAVGYAAVLPVCADLLLLRWVPAGLGIQWLRWAPSAKAAAAAGSVAVLIALSSAIGSAILGVYLLAYWRGV